MSTRHAIAKLVGRKVDVQEGRAERVGVPLPVHLRMGSVDEVFESRLVNLSKSGVFVAMAEPPPIGTRLDLDVTLENGQLLLHATAEVVRHGTAQELRGVGARFVDISFEAQALIERMASDQRAFGDYQLEALLGRGGMAEVYKARALFGPRAGYQVALKRVRPDLAGDGVFVELFARESEITRRLSHPNIVEVHDAGCIGSTCFIAMELVVGCDLRQLSAACAARGNFMPQDFACYGVHAVAESHDYAHKLCDAEGKLLGLVHRDVAPSNIFISSLGDVKLGDFGVVHLASAAAEKAVAGKLPYMAPEQLDAGDVSPATDVWGLAVVLFELLTNRRPFVHDDPKKLASLIKEGTLPSPSSLRPGLSPAIEAVLQTALSVAVQGQPRPRSWFGRKAAGPGRYPDARSFAEALAGCFDPAVGTPLGIASVVRTVLPEAAVRFGEPT